MVFNLGLNFYLVALLILCVWLSFLSFFLYRAVTHYNRLTTGVTKEDLKTVLEKILGKVDNSWEKIENLEKYYRELKEEERFHIQKIGLLRFNPFKDTGGNQSFVLALLNKEDSGLVLSSLYARSGNRWYVKKVTKGKGTEVELSQEEEEAIKMARK